jgi:hypothetical protein
MTMELLLNLLWLLIAVSLVCVWRTQWINQRRGTERRHLQEWSAVSLALVLLFFAVSMSDDLHSEIVALEECSANKRDQMHGAAGHDIARPAKDHHQAVWYVRSRPTWPRFVSAFGAVRFSEPSSGTLLSLGLRPNRAPPVPLS